MALVFKEFSTCTSQTNVKSIQLQVTTIGKVVINGKKAVAKKANPNEILRVTSDTKDIFTGTAEKDVKIQLSSVISNCISKKNHF